MSAPRAAVDKNKLQQEVIALRDRFLALVKVKDDAEDVTDILEFLDFREKKKAFGRKNVSDKKNANIPEKKEDLAPTLLEKKITAILHCCLTNC